MEWFLSMRLPRDDILVKNRGERGWNKWGKCFLK